MHKDRAKAIASDIHDHVFHTLDAEIDCGTQEIGRISAIVGFMVESLLDREYPYVTPEITLEEIKRVMESLHREKRNAAVWDKASATMVRKSFPIVKE